MRAARLVAMFCLAGLSVASVIGIEEAQFGIVQIPVFAFSLVVTGWLAVSSLRTGKLWEKLLAVPVLLMVAAIVYMMTFGAH